jgi:hypothetical protein
MCKSPKSHFVPRPLLVSLAFGTTLLTTGSPTFAQIAFADVSATAGFGGSYGETWGAAWGDVNGDLYPDVFFSNHRNRATLYRNNRNGTFSEVSDQVDLSATPGWTGGRANVDTHGASWGDIDNDGDDDLYEAVESSTDRLHTNAFGALTDRTVALGIDRLTHVATRQNVFVDFNGDGRLDLAGVALQRPAFAPQLADGSFGHGVGIEKPMACTDGQWAHLVDVHPTAGLEFVCSPRIGSYPKVNAFPGGSVANVSSGFTQFASVIDAASLDFDGDLRPDLFLVQGSERPSDAFMVSSQRFEAQFITAGGKTKSVTFRTTGVLTVNASVSAGTDPQGSPAAIEIGASEWSPASLVFQLNRGDSRTWGIGTGAPGFNIGYLTATGEWKISQGNAGFGYSYVQVSSTAPITALTFAGSSEADRGQQPVLLRNTASGLVRVANAGFGVPVRCQSVVAGDFDNDMDEDLFLACTGGSHNKPNRLYRNDGDGTFTEIAGAGGAAGKVGAAVASQAGTSESVVAADYDLDGFLDLLVTNGNNMRPVYLGGPKQLFRNRGNANHWLQLDLVGTVSNRDGLGSKIYVTTAGGRRQYREQNGGYHRWSQNFQRIHVGLGGNTRADVTVVWPNGVTRAYPGLVADRLYRVRQDGSVAAVTS